MFKQRNEHTEKQTHPGQGMPCIDSVSLSSHYLLHTVWFKYMTFTPAYQKPYLSTREARCFKIIMFSVFINSSLTKFTVHLFFFFFYYYTTCILYHIVPYYTAKHTFHFPFLLYHQTFMQLLRLMSVIVKLCFYLMPSTKSDLN